MTTRTTWTHVRAQHFDTCIATPPKSANGRRPKCVNCGKAIRPMRRNEGPEGLRAFFTF